MAAATNSNLYSGAGSLVLLVLICISASVTARNVRQSWAEDRDCALIVNEITPKQDNS